MTEKRRFLECPKCGASVPVIDKLVARKHKWHCRNCGVGLEYPLAYAAVGGPGGYFLFELFSEGLNQDFAISLSLTLVAFLSYFVLLIPIRVAGSEKFSYSESNSEDREAGYSARCAYEKSKEQPLKWFQSPAPYLLVGTVVVLWLYFMNS